ncbi:heavy-metal-associated domain-containing protein [Flavobacterium sp. '19STA2R22 D10 B1']|uniref:heavy-metal-associated domain-containing protein n=1 Tax=Flavobacterium aerium TaxID=3037261 RepID=UPI00278C385A|nr:MauE/DoxX family redox-associated membrane protein [Flavobacterium sp. '19STA2R22 D10 B1']
MTHTYQLTGMTCTSCEAKVKTMLFNVQNITDVAVSKDENTATITMDKHVGISALQEALGGSESKYHISAIQHNEVAEQTKSWFATYKPIILIFTYITGITLLVQFTGHHFDFMQWMQHFMAGFFLVFSFFKLLNLSGFAESYAMYDIVAKQFKSWGYLYAIVELALGLAFLTGFEPLYTNIVTFIVMSVSIVGVLQSVMNKKKIQCACLGAVFNLPMSTVTIIEDALMIIMSAAMIFMLL